MAQAPSIPESLHPHLVDRWLLGQSPREICDWIERSNRRRKEKVRTTPSSVRRTLLKLVSTQVGQRRITALHRAQMRAPVVQRNLERVERGFFQCLKDAAHLDGTPESRASFNGRIVALTRLSAHLHRGLRAAGVLGSAAEKLEERWEKVVNETRVRVQADDRKEAAEESSATPTPVRMKKGKGLAPAENDAKSMSSPAIVEAFERGRQQAPCEITTLRKYGLTPPAQIPLTPPEHAYAEGYAVTWGEKVGEASEPLARRTVEEVQLEKHLLALQTLTVEYADQTVSYAEVEPDPEVLRSSVSLAPDAVPSPHHGTREEREAWRKGRANLPIQTELQPIDINQGGTDEAIVLNDRELAWVAGNAEYHQEHPNPGAPSIATLEEDYESALFHLHRKKWLASFAASGERPLPGEEPDESIQPGSADVWQAPSAVAGAP